MTRSKKTSTSASVDETLVSEYEKRFAVRKKRDTIAQLAGADAHIEELKRGASLRDLPGRQTSPELAMLASKYINFQPADWDHLSRTAPDISPFCADVRSLAASVLSQAHTDD